MIRIAQSIEESSQRVSQPSTYSNTVFADHKSFQQPPNMRGNWSWFAAARSSSRFIEIFLKKKDFFLCFVFSYLANNVGQISRVALLVFEMSAIPDFKNTKSRNQQQAKLQILIIFLPSAIPRLSHKHRSMHLTIRLCDLLSRTNRNHFSRRKVLVDIVAIQRLFAMHRDNHKCQRQQQQRQKRVHRWTKIEKSKIIRNHQIALFVIVDCLFDSYKICKNVQD
jgi:hypothetical protein